jgi:hypothetical protein
MAIEKPNPEGLKEFLILGREPINLPRRLARVRYDLMADQIPQRNEMTRCANNGSDRGYSITSSAVASSVDEMVRPGAIDPVVNRK